MNEEKEAGIYNVQFTMNNLPQVGKVIGKASIRTTTVDRGYRGVSKINEVIIQSPKPFNSNGQTKHKQNKLKKQYGRRSAIEPIIEHLKSDHRMGRNFYKGIIDESINVMLSAAGYNFKRMMSKWRSFFGFIFYRHFILPIISLVNQINYSKKEIWVFKGRLNTKQQADCLFYCNTTYRQIKQKLK